MNDLINELYLNPAICIPTNPSHQKCKGRKNIAHGSCKSCCCVLSARVNQALGYYWSVRHKFEVSF